MAATNDKIIRIRSDINAAIQDAQKLQRAYTQLGGVNPALQSMVNNLNGAHGATTRAGAAANAANSNVRSLTGSVGGLGSAANAAMSNLAGMGGTLTSIGFAGAAAGITAVVGALTALASVSVGAAAQAEAQKASLATVTGSVVKAQETYAALVNYAAKTPFDVNQAVDGYIKLRALGLAPTERAMISYGNTASALGKGPQALSDMIEAVADASTGEFERLKSFGITTKQEADKFKFTFGGVTTEVAKNSEAIQKYLIELGETKFGDAMTRQMLTFNGALSNLGDAWDQTLVAIGEGGLLDAVSGAIKLITEGVGAIGPVLVGIGNAMAGAIEGVTSIASGIGDLFSAINTGGGSGISIMENLTFQFNMIGQIAQVVGAIVGGVFSAIGTAINGASSMIIGNMGAALDWLGIKWETSGRSWTNSMFGVLRGAKAVAMALPQIFQIAINDLLGMFSTLGQAITALLSGQWDKAKALASKPLFSNTGRAINAVGRIGLATYKDEAGADRAMSRMLGRDKKADAKLDVATSPKAPPASGKDSDADKAAKAAADRLKRENEFWKALKDQTTAAGMLTLQAEEYNKGLELRKILERELSDAEKTRISTALGELNTAKAITALKQRAFEAQNEYTVELGRAKGLTEQQRGVEDDLFKARIDAKNRGVDIDAVAYKSTEDALRIQLEKNAALKAQNELLKKAQDFALSMSSGAKAADDLKTIEAQYKAYTDSVAGGNMPDTFRDQIVAGFEAAKLKIGQDAIKIVLDMSPTASRNARIDTANGQFKEGMAQLAKMDLTPEARKQLEGEIYTTHKNALGKIASETTRDWVDMFDDLADTFGGKLGRVLNRFADGFDKIADMMSGNLTGPAGMLAKLLKREDTYSGTASEFSLPKIGEAIKSPLSSLSKGFGDFKSMFSTDLATGLTKGLTKMQAGAQVGGMVAGVGDLLGLGKGFSKGASIGGTVGGLFGPIGSIVGSLGGGLIGSLLSKAPKGKAILTGAGESAISGNKGSARTALTGTAASIQDGLASLASQIGGTVGAFNVSVGKYKDNFRVSSTGATNVDVRKSKKISGLIYEGKDEAAAIAAAIKDAIADGAITGLAPIVQKALAGLGADSAIQFAKDWKSAMDDYKSMTDPVGAAIDSIVTPLNSLRETMLKVGASTEDLTKIDEYRTLKLKNALKEQLASLTDFLAALKGEGSGVTQMDQLNAKMAEFDTYKARIASGDASVDQSAFTQLGQSIFSLAGDIYGTATGQFQSIRSMLTGTTQALADNVTKAFNTSAGFDVTKAAADTTTAAIQAQAASAAAHYQAQANSNAIQESWLKQIAQGIDKLGNSGGVAANDDLAYNGQYMGKTY